MERPSMKLKYRKHIFSNLNEIINDFRANESMEGRKMFAALYPTIIKLQKNKINDLKNITSVFRDCGFNNKSTNQILLFLLNKLNNSKINKRTINKLNDSYRNVIFNWLFYDFSDTIIPIIDDFISNYCPDIHNHDFLIHQLKQFIVQKNNKKDEKIVINIVSSNSNIGKVENNKANIKIECNKVSETNENDLSFSLPLLDFKSEVFYFDFNNDMEKIDYEF